MPRPLGGNVETEGFGIVFLEAAACDVPSVVGRSGGSHEAVVDGQTGTVVEPRDVDVVRDAIDVLLRDDERRRRLGVAAGVRAREEFAGTTGSLPAGTPRRARAWMRDWLA